ncbi:hypothetical protein CQZ76_01815 [Anaplasma marginale]|nr:hypothetical protein CQZ76_01815 [Anaplasma marginale]
MLYYKFVICKITEFCAIQRIFQDTCAEYFSCTPYIHGSNCTGYAAYVWLGYKGAMNKRL